MASKRIKVRDIDNEEEEEADAIWLIPDIDENDKQADKDKISGYAQQLNRSAKHKEKGRRKHGTSTVDTRAASSATIGIRPPISTNEELWEAQNTALCLVKLIKSHPMYSKLITTGDGYTLRMENPYTNKTDVIFLRGITKKLAELGWPTIRFFQRKEKKSKVPPSASLVADQLYMRVVDSNGFEKKTGSRGKASTTSEILSEKEEPKEKRSAGAIFFDAKKRGTDFHKQLALYSELYIEELELNGNLDNLSATFERRVKGEVLPAVQTVIRLFGLPQYQMIPLMSEVVVCDTAMLDDYFSDKRERAMKKKEKAKTAASTKKSNFITSFLQTMLWDSGEVGDTEEEEEAVKIEEEETGPKVYGTAVDMLVYLIRQRTFGFLEFISTKGDFLRATTRMEGHFGAFDNNVLNRKLFQGVLTGKYFFRTFGSIFTDNKISTNCNVYVIAMSPDGKIGDVHVSSPTEQKAMLSVLAKTELLHAGQ